MKKLLLLALLCAPPTAGFSQGAINWGTSFGTSAFIPVFGPDPARPTLSLSGASTISGVKPTGGTVYGGLLLTGTGYTFGVFAGPTPDTMSMVASTTFRTWNSTANVLPKGLVLGNSTNVPGAPAGTSAYYQIRAWDNLGGTLTDWAMAAPKWETGAIAAGCSAVLPIGPLGGIGSDGGSISSPNTKSWSSFNIYYMNVIGPPNITYAGPTNLNVMVGASARFTVTAGGAPPLSYEWFFNDKPLDNATSSVLTLTGVQVQQSGAYNVVVSNALGVTSLAQPLTLNVVPWLGFNMVPAITLNGGVGVTFRIEYLNMAGSPEPWVPLDTVTMTNNPQFYFDVSAIGQPARVYRLVQLP